MSPFDPVGPSNFQQDHLQKYITPVIKWHVELQRNLCNLFPIFSAMACMRAFAFIFCYHQCTCTHPPPHPLHPGTNLCLGTGTVATELAMRAKRTKATCAHTRHREFIVGTENAHGGMMVSVASERLSCPAGAPGTGHSGLPHARWDALSHRVGHVVLFPPGKGPSPTFFHSCLKRTPTVG